MPPVAAVTILTLFLLAGAICTVWAPSISFRHTRVAPWTIVALAAAVSGLLAGALHLHGLLALLALASAALVAATSSKPAKRIMAGVFTAVLALALALLTYRTFSPRPAERRELTSALLPAS